MFRSGLEQTCPGLKLPCVAHVGCFDEGGTNCQLATTLAAVRFSKEPHERIPSEGFDLLMRRDNVQDIEAYLAIYDMQDLRDWLYASGRPYVVSLLFQPWLFPTLAYRGEETAEVEGAIFGSAGVFPVADSKESLTKGLKRFEQRVWVKDKVYMCMGPETMQIRVDRHRLICSFWSLCIPVDSERAVATKHVFINESHTHISQEVRNACLELSEASVAACLRHLQKLLTSVQNATHRLSKLMARCEGAFDGVFLDGSAGGGPFSGPTEPMEVWEEQLGLLDRSVSAAHTAAKCPAPLLSDMLRRRVYEDLGKKKRGGKFPPDDDETILLGEKHFLTSATGPERALAVHRVLIEWIHDLENLSEGNNEMLAVDGVTA